MEEEELELWYEEQKQMLSEKFLKNIDKGMDRDRRSAIFDKAWVALNRKYESRYTRLLAAKKAKERNKKLLRILASPFLAAGRAISFVFRSIFGVISRVIKYIYSGISFKFWMFWTKRGHRIYEPVQNFFRPVYYSYAKHIKPTVLVITSPFRKLGKYIQKKKEALVEWTISTAKLIWKYTMKAAKATYKKIESVIKFLAARYEERAKQYREWYAKRVQAAADKKQARKEAKEAKLKVKEEAKNAKAEGKTEDATKAAEGTKTEDAGASENTGVAAETPAV